MELNGIVVNVALTACLIIGLAMIVMQNWQVDGKINRYFIAYIAVVSLLLVFDVWEYYLIQLPRLNELRYLTTAMCYTLRAVAITVMNILLYQGKRSRALLWLPVIVLALFAFTNPYTHWICYFNESNFWCGGALRFLPHVISGICFLLLLVKAIPNQKEYRSDIKILFLFSVTINILATIVETAFPVRFLLTGTMMVACVFYYSIINKQNEISRAKKQEQALAQGRISIMLSQIQPHFLYNALTTIRVLCRCDPQKAEQATIEFTEFLRGNMDSLSAETPISFEKELAHTRNYLNLERMRFPDRLHIVYKIGPTLFRLPTLTLQPIVENAVRYGVTKRVEGGMVTISTRETDNTYVVTVIDDGVGYDPRQVQDDGRTHIGISNVRMRLAAMCGGTLSIISTPGVGTEAKIEIPKVQ